MGLLQEDQNFVVFLRTGPYCKSTVFGFYEKGWGPYYKSPILALTTRVVALIVKTQRGAPTTRVMALTARASSLLSQGVVLL